MRAGLDVLLSDTSSLKGARVGLCCNHTAVTRGFDHALPALTAAGVSIRRVFGPEHGVDSTAQDMIAVDDGPTARTDTPAVVSLYGDSEASLHPPEETLADLDVLLFDIQDIGARYYTYQATLGFIMEVAARTGTEVVVLDRPNPIDGVSLEGNVVEPGFESFVGAYPLANRHGMTMGELGRYFKEQLGIDAPYRVVPVEGWQRHQWLDETPLPWVYPSPNMPTLETAAIYPGMCLIEGTNLSEGRGTTRPFHLVGAPWLDRARFTELCRKGAADAGLSGVAFREATFEPRFQKHAGEVCHGTEVFVTDRHAMHALLLGMVVLEAALRADPDRFGWRTETYEFVDEPIAIDLLFGTAEGRVGLESRVRPAELLEAWGPTRAEWEDKRQAALLY
ncbi:MAG: DUF1343 domain-containing protein [Myxococcota bacterium]|nr:DUF1343 domain-containing protein [Myxococcota bacterium]